VKTLASRSSTSSSEADLHAKKRWSWSAAGAEGQSNRYPPDGWPDFLGDRDYPADPDRSRWIRRLPWGGVIALALVLLFDQVMFSLDGPWEWQLARLPDADPLERGLIVDRLEARRARDLPHDRPRVTLVGTSRMDAAFRPEYVPEEVTPPIHFFRQAHARVYPHEMRSLLHEIIGHEPDLVVIMVSELELMMPFKIVPQATGGSLRAVLELVARTGLAFAHENRMAFLRMIGVGLLDAYRYKGVMGKSLTNRWRRFPRRGKVERSAPTWPDLIADGAPMTVDPAVEEAIMDALYEQFADRPESVSFQTGQVRSVRPGAHADLKFGIMDRNLELLRAEGIEVVLIEGVVHPATYALYDEERCRGIFLDWARRAADADPGVHFAPRDELGGLLPADHFRDITHVNKLGARRLTQRIMDWCAWHLTPDWRAELEERYQRLQRERDGRGPAADDR